MRPSRFDYARPDSVAQALDLLATHEDARVLAGGQSLMPLLNLRLAQPSLLVDINGLADLNYISADETGLRVGALVRHAELLANAAVKTDFPLLAAALGHVAHDGIRNRGTVCGSLAFADPSAELPACAVALGAELVLASARGQRAVPAAAFFQGIYETAIEPDEMVLEVRFPRVPAGWHFAFQEIARRRGDFAMAGVIAGWQLQRGQVAEARVVTFALGPTPTRVPGAESALAGANPGNEAAAEAACAALDNVEIMESGEYPVAYKRHLAAVLLRRALRRLAEGTE